MGETFDSNTWLLVASSVLLFLGGLANLFCLAAVKNSAKAEASQPYKAYVRHTKYLQHAVDAFLNLFTILLIHLPYSVLTHHIQAVPAAVVVWAHILRSVSRTASLAAPFAFFKLTAVYREAMVVFVYASSFLVALYTTIFNSLAFFDILRDFQDEMVWVTWMMTIQNWILPGVILISFNVTYLVLILLNERENRKMGMNLRYGWKLWIAVYGFSTTLIFIGSNGGFIMAHPLSQKVLPEDLTIEVGTKITPHYTLLLPNLLSLLNPLLQTICLQKFREDCVDLLNTWGVW